MATSTTNIQKMRKVSAELEKIYATMANNKKKLDETLARLEKVWHGEGAQSYQNAYKDYSEDFETIAWMIESCAQSMKLIADNYSKADMAAADAVKSRLARG